MKRLLSIARATAQEVLSEPLQLLLTAFSLALAVVAPALHYHQFGEPSRMAREAGLSALLVGGLLYAVFGTVKTIRRELETGTAQMALAHSVSRAAFFFGKLLGVGAALAVFFMTVAAAYLTAVRGAELGAIFAEAHGYVPKTDRTLLAFSLAPLFLAPVAAAALNRFYRFRFVPTAALLALVSAVPGVFVSPDFKLYSRLALAAIPVYAPLVAFLAISGAAALRFKDHLAVSISLVCATLALPFFGNYYLADALSKGGSINTAYILAALAGAVPIALAAFLAGVLSFTDRDVV